MLVRWSAGIITKYYGVVKVRDGAEKGGAVTGAKGLTYLIGLETPSLAWFDQQRRKTPSPSILRRAEATSSSRLGQ